LQIQRRKDIFLTQNKLKEVEMSAVNPKLYVQNQWNEVKRGVIQESVLWTIYDIALKALAYCALWIPLIGIPLSISLGITSLFLDIAILKQPDEYLEGLRSFFSENVTPSLENSSIEVQSKAEKAKQLLSIFS
jgi:hypothetical protein